MLKTYFLLVLLTFLFFLQKAHSQTNYLEEAKKAYDFADYSNALSFYEKVVEKAKANEDVEYQLKGELGMINTLIKTSKLIEAEKLISELQRRKNIENNPNFINLNALFLLQKGEGEKSINELQKGIKLLTESTNDSLKAKFYNDLGIAFWNTGRDQQGLDYLSQSLSINTQLFKNNHPEVAANYNNMGLIYSNIDSKKALEYYEMALAIYQNIYPKDHPSVGNAYVNVGAAYNLTDETLSADYTLKQALSIFQTVYGENHPTVAFVYNNLGVTALKNEGFSEAINYHNKALSIYHSIYSERHQEIANSFNLLGNVYFEQSDFRLALENYQKALIANTLGFDDTDIFSNSPTDDYINVLTILNTIVSKAKAFEALHYGKTLKFKHLQAALDTYEVGDQLVDAIRTVRDSEADKLALSATASDIYQKAIELCLNLAEVSLKPKYYKEKAFYFSEKNKSAVLLSAISDTKAKEFVGIPASFLEEENEIKNEIAFLQQQLAIAENDDEKEQFRKSLFNQSEAYNAFIADLGGKYPDYYALKYAVKVATAEELQSQLDSKSAILSYSYSAESQRMFVFLITQTQFRTFNLPILQNIEDQIAILRSAIIWEMDEDYTQVAHELYKQLIPSKIPSSIKEIVIIPDGILGTTPFEVFLREKQNIEEEINWTTLPYLSKKFRTSYAYSATLFQEQLKQQNKLEDASIFLCAPVNFHENEVNDRRRGLNSLPATLTEVEKIKSIFDENGLEADIFLKDEAHEEVVKSPQLQKYKYLHFATHGIVDEEYPELSQVFLTSDDDETHDGDLYSGEIYNLKINADLVTLSACQTGLGKVTKGEGIMGLSRALLYAGADNLVVSLWAVSDASTSELMIDFYEEIARNPNIAYTDALQKAKQKMIGSKEYAAPYFWAPFILIGR